MGGIRKKVSKFNIAIFHLAFIYSGGGEKLVLQEAEGLKNLGHNVRIFTSVVNRKHCFPDLLKKIHIETFLPQFRYLVEKHESTLILLSCALAPFFAFRFRNFDVIIAANQPSPWIAYWVNKLFAVPYISYLAQPTRILHARTIDKKTGLKFAGKTSSSFSARLVEKVKPFIKWADEVSIRNSDSILANGNYIKSVLENVYRVPVTSCPAGVQHQIGNNKSKIAKRKRYLLITNRHYAQKRFEYGLFTLAYIIHKHPGFRLIITGEETDYTRTVRAVATQLGLSDSVDFVGYVNEAKLAKLYKEATVYLYTAPEEDFGMGIIEAMAVGTPVVAWNNAGPTGIIKHNVTGLLTRPFDAADFSRQVERLLSNTSFYNKISKSAPQSIKKDFSFKSHVNLLAKQLTMNDKQN